MTTLEITLLAILAYLYLLGAAHRAYVNYYVEGQWKNETWTPSIIIGLFWGPGLTLQGMMTALCWFLNKVGGRK